MKRLYIISIALVALLLIYFWFFNSNKTQLNNDQQVEQPVGTAQSNWETQTDDQPPVTVKVTPVELGKSAKIWKFSIAFDTHTGSLDDDPLKVVILSDDKGNLYRPISWEGPGPGGHHREGILVFRAINPAPLSIELKIRNVSGVPERSFKWNIE